MSRLDIFTSSCEAIIDHFQCHFISPFVLFQVRCHRAMIPLNHGARHIPFKSSYICLSCRLKHESRNVLEIPPSDGHGDVASGPRWRRTKAPENEQRGELNLDKERTRSAFRWISKPESLEGEGESIARSLRPRNVMTGRTGATGLNDFRRRHRDGGELKMHRHSSGKRRIRDKDPSRSERSTLGKGRSQPLVRAHIASLRVRRILKDTSLLDPPIEVQSEKVFGEEAGQSSQVTSHADMNSVANHLEMQDARLTDRYRNEDGFGLARLRRRTKTHVHRNPPLLLHNAEEDLDLPDQTDYGETQRRFRRAARRITRPSRISLGYARASSMGYRLKKPTGSLELDMQANAPKFVQHRYADSRPLITQYYRDKEIDFEAMAREKEALAQERDEQMFGILDAHGAAIEQATRVEEKEEANQEAIGQEGGIRSSYRPFASTVAEVVTDLEEGKKQAALASTQETEGEKASPYLPFVFNKNQAHAKESSDHADVRRLAKRTKAQHVAKQPVRLHPLFPTDGTSTRSNADADPSFLSSLQRWNIRPSFARSLYTFHSPARSIHVAARKNQEAAAINATVDFDESDSPFSPSVRSHKHSRIRQELRHWQELNANPEDGKPEPSFDTDDGASDDIFNFMTRLPDMGTLGNNRGVDNADHHTDNVQLASDSRDGMVQEGPTNMEYLYLNTGDLVELDFAVGERNSMLGVFVRRISGTPAQFFTMRGRWMFANEKEIMWSVPGWASKAEVEPLMKYIPTPSTFQEMEDLRTLMVTEDLSVPRSVSAPLVTRLSNFWNESQDIYRKNASVLDNAHDRIAHDTDLRYGSVVSAAENLLAIPKRDLPATALFAVRTAIRRAGFGFNIDRRSHRMTGYLQIRSKEQVRMVEYVRDWIRAWQDDLAKRTALEAEGNHTALRKHKTNRRAQYIYSFLEKARNIILKSREDRPLPLDKPGNIGTSRKHFPITNDSQAVKVTQDSEFSEQDTELVRFIEAWCCSQQLTGLTTLQSLPPMLLQATGLYTEYEMMDLHVGFTFLQELGTLMPYENRVRFDQHLLLPSSQHSKPLQNLMSSLIEMQHNVQFTDSMKSLRKDWGDLPVYCVDDAGAQEIDDGISIEQVEGKVEYWLHAHVANPTAFFERDHALAKMARHMGESIYMPERSYMMLPRWATGKYFSLTKDRPCMTFSTRVDAEGSVLETKITPGYIRNVISLTPSEVASLLGEEDAEEDQIVLTVGGEPPPARARQSKVDQVSDDMVEELELLKKLTNKISHSRKARGGLFLEITDIDVRVWQSNKGEGLAWDQPHRRGSRTVEGDPVIRMTTSGFKNPFDAKVSEGKSMVREMMLLAGETAAKWCAERGIPTLYRGTVPKLDEDDADAFYREKIVPALEKRGEIPPHLGVQYFQMLGKTVLTSTPRPHKVAGLDMYVKTTSPLRRYGDMIVHWQIQAALREEAKRGRKLVPDDIAHKPSMLPFSTNVLETIMLGIQPREALISGAKKRSQDFWTAMVLFRAAVYKECELPCAITSEEHAATGKPLMRFFVASEQKIQECLPGMETTLNMPAMCHDPSWMELGEAKRGDVWEAELVKVDVYKRRLYVRPTRLLERPEED